MVDFLVHDQYRYTGMGLFARFALREFATSLLIAAVDCCPFRGRINVDVVFRRYRAAAPRAASQLGRRGTAGIELFGITNILNCFMTVLSGAGRYLVSDP